MAASAGAAPSIDRVLKAAFPASDGLAGHLRRAVARHLLQKQLDGAASKSRFVPESPPCTDTKAQAGALRRAGTTPCQSKLGRPLQVYDSSPAPPCR
jgi:hypothetical protein